MPERILRRIVWHLNGKRGAILVLHGLIYYLIGWSYLTAPDIVARTKTFGFIPTWIDPPLLGIPWVASASCAVFFSIYWPRLSDRWGFMAATLMPLLWSLLFLTGWINGYNPLAWISAVLYLGYALIIMVVAGWPNPTNPADLRLPKPPDLRQPSGGTVGTNGGPVWTIISVAIASILTLMGVLAANRNAQRVASQQIKSEENIAQIQSLGPVYGMWKDAVAELRQQLGDCRFNRTKLKRRCDKAIYKLREVERYTLELRKQAVLNGVPEDRLPPLPSGFGEPVVDEVAGDDCDVGGN